MTNWMLSIATPNTVIQGQKFVGDGIPDQGGILMRAPGCKIISCSFQNLATIGIAMSGEAKQTFISDCDFSNTSMQAIAFMDNGADYGDSIVESNRISNTGLDAISIGGTGRIVVKNNRILGSNAAGIYALTGTRDALIEGNIISDSFGGIDVSWTVANGSRAGQDLTSGIIITGNRIMRCSGGIGTASNGTVIANNIVTDSGATTTGYSAGTRPIIPNGIGITDASNCLVTGNITGNISPNTTQLYGFLMRRIYDPPSNNRIQNNNFINNTQAHIAGWYANARSDNVLKGNNIIV